MPPKLARKKSTDPSQEALREHKDAWNKEVSLLIAQLIAFKKGLNGRGEPRAGLPPSSIKEPLPTEVGSYLLEIAERFHRIAEESKQIMREQGEYSKNRRKSRKEMPAFNLAANDINQQLTKQASWWLSRLWSYTKNYPRFWNKMLKLRMDALWEMAELVSLLKETQDYLISPSSEAIPRAIYSLSKMTPTIEKIAALILKQGTLLITVSSPEGLEQIGEPEEKAPQEEMPELSGAAPAPQVDLDFDFLEMLRDENTKAGVVISAIAAQGKLTPEDVKELHKIQRKLDALTLELLHLKIDSSDLLNPEKASQIKLKYNEVRDLYAAMLVRVADALGISKDNLTFDSLLGRVKESFLAIENPILEKLADNFLTRLINKWRLGVLPSPIDKFRLELYNKLKDLKDEADHLQDLLEDNDISVEIILNSAAEFFNVFSDFCVGIYKLGSYHNTLHAEEQLDINKPESKEVKQKELEKVYMLAKKLKSASIRLEELVKDLHRSAPEAERVENAE